MTKIASLSNFDLSFYVFVQRPTKSNKIRYFIFWKRDKNITERKTTFWAIALHKLPYFWPKTYNFCDFQMECASNQTASKNINSHKFKDISRLRNMSETKLVLAHQSKSRRFLDTQYDRISMIFKKLHFLLGYPIVSLRSLPYRSSALLLPDHTHSLAGNHTFRLGLGQTADESRHSLQDENLKKAKSSGRFKNSTSFVLQ